MLWKPEVNLLVLSRVGGVSVLGMRLTKDGTVASPFLCAIRRKKKMMTTTLVAVLKRTLRSLCQKNNADSSRLAGRSDEYTISSHSGKPQTIFTVDIQSFGV